MSDYRLLRQIIKTRKSQGTALEFGVATGESTRIIAARMPVIGFDCFTGLPEAWDREPTEIGTTFPAGTFAQAEPPQIDNVELVIGLFEDTLPGYQIPDDVSLVHIDVDLFSSTQTVLKHIGGQLHPGTVIVFDEFQGYGGAEHHESKAFAEAVAHYHWTVLPLGTHDEQKAFILQ